MIDTVRYVVAVFVVVTIPLIYFFWFFIHPFAKFWRKIESWWTYGVLFSLFVPVIFVLYYYREFLIGTNYGFHPILSITGLVFYFVAVVIYLKRREYLTNKIMLGYPEISEKGYPGKLFTEGIYSQIRHPRYVEIQLSFIGYSLFANFLGAYILTFILIPALYITVLFEEKELIERFGEDYIKYSKSVPRFFHKIKFK